MKNASQRKVCLLSCLYYKQNILNLDPIFGAYLEIRAYLPNLHKLCPTSLFPSQFLQNTTYAPQAGLVAPRRERRCAMRRAGARWSTNLYLNYLLIKQNNYQTIASFLSTNLYPNYLVVKNDTFYPSRAFFTLTLHNIHHCSCSCQLQSNQPLNRSQVYELRSNINV